jgi:crotonobetainyl-CoA:carnitine CoA-transferase CaiB-like acyl-CoA transferase
MNLGGYAGKILSVDLSNRKISEETRTPQILSGNMIVEVEYENSKELKILGNPIKMSEIDQEIFTRPPRLGDILRKS